MIKGNGADAPAGLAAGIELRLGQMLAGAGLCGSTDLALGRAMRHSVLLPAKRARGLLVLLAAGALQGSHRDEAFSGTAEGGQSGPDARTATRRAMTGACAVELIHAASLIVDDLPCMDDAQLRRGQPVCHRIFGENTTILSAIALMTLAFEMLATDPLLPPEVRAGAIASLARATGRDGLAGGQDRDLNPLPGPCAVTDIEATHAGKTGALFAAAAEIGAMVAGASHESQAAMAAFGMQLGLAFQGFDDLLDYKSSVSRLGKDVGRDGRKLTLVTLLGPQDAEARCEQHLALAMANLQASGCDGEALKHYVETLRLAMLARGEPRALVFPERRAAGGE